MNPSSSFPSPAGSLTVSSGEVVVAESGLGLYTQTLLDGRHLLTADEPLAAGGADLGPGPYELLIMALGACTSMTLRMYAARHQWPLTRVVVRLKHARVYAKDCEDCAVKAGFLDRIDREIELLGPLSEPQRDSLMQMADKCPVHRTLTGTVTIVTRRSGAGAVAPESGSV